MSNSFQELKIDPQFRDLIPPLSEEERKQLEDNLIADPRSEERTAMVYASYKSWCFDNGHRAESMKTFKQGLMTMGSVVRRRPRNGGSETTLLEGYRLVSDFLT